MVGKIGKSGRTKSTPDGGRKEKQTLRILPNYGEKKLILNYYLDLKRDKKNKKCMDAVRQKFFSSLNDDAWENQRKNIYKWMEPVTLQKIMKVKGKCLEQQKIRMYGAATTLPADAEMEVIVWIKELRNEGAPVPGIIVRQKAREVALERGINESLFCASATWLSLFLRRHKLSLRMATRRGQIRPSDAELVKVQFAREVNEKMLKLGISEVWAADQTAMFYEYVSKNTVNAKGSKTVWIRAAGKEKQRITLMLLGSSTGQKKPPWIIFKSADSTVEKTRRQNIELRHGFGKDVWTEVDPLQRNERGITTCQIYRNKAGWWNSNLMQDWLQFNFGFRIEMKDNPILLLVDDFSGHWTESVQKYAEKLNVHLMRVPPGYTCVAAPPDVAWNHPLKSYLRKEWLNDLYRQFSSPREENVRFILQPAKRPLIVSWALQAWESLSSRIITAGFRGVGIQVDYGPSLYAAVAGDELDEEIEKLSNSVFDELAKLQLIEKDFTISTDDSDVCEENVESDDIIDVDLNDEDGTEKDVVLELEKDEYEHYVSEELLEEEEDDIVELNEEEEDGAVEEEEDEEEDDEFARRKRRR